MKDLGLHRHGAGAHGPSTNSDGVDAGPSLLDQLGARVGRTALQRKLAQRLAQRQAAQGSAAPAAAPAAGAAVQRKLPWDSGHFAYCVLGGGGNTDKEMTVGSALSNYEHGYDPQDPQKAIDLLQELERRCVAYLDTASDTLHPSLSFRAREIGVLLRDTRGELEREREKLVTGKLSNMRQNPLTRSMPNAQGALDPVVEGLLREQMLKQQRVSATLTKSHDVFPIVNPKNLNDIQNTAVHMNHNLEFDTDRKDVRYIRFVKATTCTGRELSCTVPGFVTYGQKEVLPRLLINGAKQGDPQARSKLVELVKEAHKTKAQWSYDGPHQEFKPNEKNLVNIDTPGAGWTRKENFPYIIITDFIGVLFDPAELTILNVTSYDDMLVEYGDNYPESKTPPPNTGAKNNPFI